MLSKLLAYFALGFVFDLTFGLTFGRGVPYNLDYRGDTLKVVGYLGD